VAERDPGLSRREVIMQVLIVTVAEARQHLTELIARVAAGDQVVIAENGKSVATLGRPPMFPTTPEEVAASEPGRIAFIRSVVESHDRDGNPLPADHPLRAMIAPERGG
jgi:antitoxin (DNA-binding transcriptional repressor) of toxin-antitoxin stability system